MNITVNGKSETVSACSIYEFIEDKGLNPKTVIVEHNFALVKRPDWPDTQLGEGDSLEVLNFVCGG